MHSSDQYLLDFTSRANERCSRAVGLREARLPIEMTAGRVEGVVELVQRLTLLCRDLPEDLRADFTTDAQVVAIAARVERRPTKSEKTIRNWTADARALGILTVCYSSQQYGGSRWNRYTIHFGRLLDLIAGPLPPASRLQPPASIPGGNGRKRAVTVTAPGAETVTAPDIVFTNVVNTHSPLTALAPPASEGERVSEDFDLDVLIRDVVSVGVSKARGAVATGASVRQPPRCAPMRPRPTRPKRPRIFNASVRSTARGGVSPHDGEQIDVAE